MNNETHKTISVNARMESYVYVNINVPIDTAEDDINKLIHESQLNGSLLTEISKYGDYGDLLRWDKPDFDTKFDLDAIDMSDVIRQKNIVSHEGYDYGAYVHNENETFDFFHIEHKYDGPQTVIKTKDKMYNVHPPIKNEDGRNDDLTVYPIRYEYTGDYERKPEHFTKLIREQYLTGWGFEWRTIDKEPL